MGALFNINKGLAVFCALSVSIMGFGQVPDAPPPQDPVVRPSLALLSPDQLDNLVAPVALYPDPLLGQVLAASTYPLEIVEAQRWLQQNGNLHGQQLIDAARQQNWDPSVQALVAFPDALNLLDRNIQWTTDLGNAFLAQQADVMNAVQRMRERASANGKLVTTPQQVVTTETQNGQSAIQIQPADPQVIYVPVYQPYYVWGPPVWGAYPPLWYPPGFGFGFGFGPGIYIGTFFPGWVGWGGWGWGFGWFGSGLYVNAAFFGHYGYHGYGGYGGYWRGGYGYGGHTAWAHDPGHRMGVSYPNQAVANRFNSNRFAGSRFSGATGQQFNGAAGNARNFNGGNRAGANGFAGSSRPTSPNFGSRPTAPGQQFNGANGNARSFSGGNQAGANGFASRQGSPTYGSRSTPGQAFNAAPAYRGGGASPSYSRSFTPGYSGGARSYAAPRSYSAPQYSAPRQSFSAPRSSGPSFSGGSSHFSGGGGHSGSSGGHGGGGGGGGHHR